MAGRRGVWWVAAEQNETLPDYVHLPHRYIRANYVTDVAADKQNLYFKPTVCGLHGDPTVKLDKRDLYYWESLQSPVYPMSLFEVCRHVAPLTVQGLSPIQDCTDGTGSSAALKHKMYGQGLVAPPIPFTGTLSHCILA